MENFCIARTFFSSQITIQICQTAPDGDRTRCNQSCLHLQAHSSQAIYFQIACGLLLRDSNSPRLCLISQLSIFSKRFRLPLLVQHFLWRISYFWGHDSFKQVGKATATFLEQHAPFCTSNIYVFFSFSMRTFGKWFSY